MIREFSNTEPCRRPEYRTTSTSAREQAWRARTPSRAKPSVGTAQQRAAGPEEGPIQIRVEAAHRRAVCRGRTVR